MSSRQDVAVSTAIDILVDEFKSYAATDPGERQLVLEQKILEGKIYDLQKADKETPKEKTAQVMDRVVSLKNLERKLTDNKTPIEFLIDVYSDNLVDDDGKRITLAMDYRLKAATSCLAYVHRKLPTAVEHNVDASGKVEHEHSMKIEFVEAVAIENDIIMVERVEDDE